MINTLRTADTDDLPAAAALLYRAALASPTGRLLGSATTKPHAMFAEVLTTGMCFGRVDLAVTGDRIDGVACWIDHPNGPIRLPAPPRPNAIDDLLGRLHTIDLIMAVPDRHPHKHLACLGTRPGHQTRAVADLLLHHQTLLNDRHGRTFYTEAHDREFKAWLLRSGYDYHGVSMGTDDTPESYLVSYTGRAP